MSAGREGWGGPAPITFPAPPESPPPTGVPTLLLVTPAHVPLQEDDMDGIHIVAFAEEDDPGEGGSWEGGPRGPGQVLAPLTPIPPQMGSSSWRS